MNEEIRQIYINFIKSGLKIKFIQKARKKKWKYITRAGNIWKNYPEDVPTYRIINIYGVR